MALRGPNPRAGSKGCGLLSRTLGSDLALFVPGQDRTGPSARETGRISGTKQRSPRSANSRPLRWVVVRNPRANAGFPSIPIGQEPGPVLRASWHLASSCHSTRISDPHLISEFSSRTDKSASSPGCSSSAKLGDLSQMARRVEHAPRRGTMHSSL